MEEPEPTIPPRVFQMCTEASKTLLKQRILLGTVGIGLGILFHFCRLFFSSIDKPLAAIIESLAVLEFLIGIALIVGELAMYTYKRRARIEIDGDVISQFAKGSKRILSGPMNDIKALRTMSGFVSGFIFQNRTVNMVDFGKLRLISFAHDIANRELLISILESHTGKKFNRRKRFLE